MARNGIEIVSGVLLDDAALTLDELAHACGMPLDWVHLHVEAGILPAPAAEPAGWRFSSRDLRRARQLCALERDFDALPELAALVIDLQEEIARLRRRLGRAATDD
jgi:chaperone modulatory protein CbpM